MRRSTIAIAAVVVIAAVAAVIRLRRPAPLAERLAAGAAKLRPDTLWFRADQNGVQIGGGHSAIVRTPAGFLADDELHGRAIVYGDSQSIVATSHAVLSRRFAVDSFDLFLGGDEGPFSLSGHAPPAQLMLLPQLAPTAVMLSGPARIGREEEVWMYNPLSQRPERTTLRIVAESLFRIPDRVLRDSARRTWTTIHADTVRAWEITTPTQSVTAWVDAQGRLVSASEPGGLSLARTVPEVARLNEVRIPAPKPRR